MPVQTLIRTNNVYGFRSGEWAELKGTETFVKGSGRLCFHVTFPDGAEDWWVIGDPQGQYEFCEVRRSANWPVQ